LWFGATELKHVAEAVKKDKQLTIAVVGTGSSILSGPDGPPSAYPARLEAALKQKLPSVAVKVVTLVRPTGSPAASSVRPSRTASGSVAVPGARARVARAGRIYVEGRHDAELVEKVWGDDLRVEGVVVEYLEGINDLPAIVTEFAPGPDARLGILVDHLVPGTKEFRIARSVTSEHALVVGHPYIDVWEAVKPASLGIPGWPRIPHGQDWKTGVCRELGWPENTGAVWRAILARVGSYRDLEPELLGRVEELIDFVTAPPSSPSGV
jgi:hypothetical protein